MQTYFCGLWPLLYQCILIYIYILYIAFGLVFFGLDLQIEHFIARERNSNQLYYQNARTFNYSIPISEWWIVGGICLDKFNKRLTNLFADYSWLRLHDIFGNIETWSHTEMECHITKLLHQTLSVCIILEWALCQWHTDLNAIIWLSNLWALNSN